MNAQEEKVVVASVSNVTPEWLKRRMGIMAELDRQLIQAVKNPGTGLTLDQLQLVTEHKNPFAINPENLLADWYKFYRQEFIIEPGNVQIPPQQSGFDRLIVIVQGLTIQQAYDRCADNFPCWKWTDGDLDGAVPTNDRSPNNGAYAIWVRDRVEADEELKNQSANKLQRDGIAGITLLERVIFELKYYKETGKHLDIRNVTLCSGSRDADGYVPDAGWHDDEFDVSYSHLGFAFDDLRARQVVSSAR